MTGLLRHVLGQLHGERALTMVSTFQLTRSARLRLAHQEGTENSEMGVSVLLRFGRSFLEQPVFDRMAKMDWIRKSSWARD